MNRTDLTKIIDLCEEHFEESCFNKVCQFKKKINEQ